jgi:hypothetical protein
MWCRRSWFSLNGKVGIQGSETGRSSYGGPACSATGRIRATTSLRGAQRGFDAFRDAEAERDFRVLDQADDASPAAR